MAAPKKTETKEETKVVTPKNVKYRHDFKSWEEYNKYTGPKA